MKRLICIILFVAGIYFGIAGHIQKNSQPDPTFPISSGSANPILKIDVYYLPQDTVISLDLEEYVKGVVGSEMPASFNMEALKAQAILARTYAVRKMKVLGGIPSRTDSDVSSDHTKDQAWAPVSVIKDKLGIIGSWLHWPKIEKAVEETRGLILTHEGLVCEALYHSTCGGQTEAASQVWGKDVPYLQSVSCNYCQTSPYYKESVVNVTTTQVSLALGNIGLSIPASKVQEQGTIAVSQVSQTGRVKELIVNGQRIRGVEFRAALGLRSTKFTWIGSGNNIQFRVKGYGHGVGLCQYGANGMAKDGRNYLEILGYYYPGTSVTRIFEE